MATYTMARTMLNMPNPKPRRLGCPIRPVTTPNARTVPIATMRSIWSGVSFLVGCRSAGCGEIAGAPWGGADRTSDGLSVIASAERREDARVVAVVQGRDRGREAHRPRGVRLHAGGVDRVRARLGHRRVERVGGCRVLPVAALGALPVRDRADVASGQRQVGGGEQRHGPRVRGVGTAAWDGSGQDVA